MKNFLKKISTTIAALAIMTAPQIANAAVLLEDVFRKYRVNGRTEYSELNNTANLPDPDIVDLIIEIIDIILRVSGILTFLAFTVGGIMYIVSRGEGDGTTLEKAKKIMMYSVVGVVVIMSAFAIVLGITTLRYNV